MITLRKPKTEFVVIDNLRIRYQDSAKVGAKALVFIHGLGGSIESWKIIRLSCPKSIGRSLLISRDLD